jgi:hypothetical protein
MNLPWLILSVSTLLVFTAQETGNGDRAGLIQIALARGIKQSTGAEGVFLYTFVRESIRRESLVLTAGAAFETNVTNPDRRKCVSLVAAMPFNLGDGALLKISIRGGAQQDSSFQIFLDPVHVRAHRSWLPLRLEIPSAPEQILLHIQVEAGSRGNYTADWVGLAAGGDSECLLAAQTISMPNR